MNQEFVSLLATVGILLPLRRPSQLNRESFASKIMSLSEGIIGEIIRIMSLLAIKAIETKLETIDEKLLKKINYLSPTERRRQFDNISL